MVLVRQVAWGIIIESFQALLSSLKSVEEFIDQILLYCASVGILWQVSFYLFGINWVTSSSIRPILLSQNGLFVGKWCKKCGWLPLCSCLGKFDQREIGAPLTMWNFWNNHSNHFSCAVFLDGLRHCIGETCMSMLGFVDWLDSYQAWEPCMCPCIIWCAFVVYLLYHPLIQCACVCVSISISIYLYIYISICSISISISISIYSLCISKTRKKKS